MGDSIICNGLVRHLLSTQTETITLIAKKSIENSMRFMYRDLPTLDFLFFDTYDAVAEFIKTNNPRPILKFGFEYISHHEHLASANIQFDQMYYHLANLPFSLRWDNFFVLRDHKREAELFEKFNIKEHDYIFVHDVYSTEIPFMKEGIFRKDLPIVKPIIGMTDTIFDYLYLIEHAAEVHCVCSSFKNLIDSLTTVHCPLFFHKNRGSFKDNKKWISSCRLDWIHIDY